MALMGADLLLYPTAIGSEPPPASDIDSSAHWQRTMQGHAAANMIPLIASNRIGVERATSNETLQLTFYGQSFIADHTGKIVQLADDHSETVLVHQFDMDAIRSYREALGVFRDRRPEQYQAIATLDGHFPTPHKK